MLVAVSCEIPAGLLTGRVLAVSPIEMTVEWSELGGILSLKSIAMSHPSMRNVGDAAVAPRAAALELNAWGLEASRRAAIEAAFGAALERLAKEEGAIA